MKALEHPDVAGHAGEMAALLSALDGLRRGDAKVRLRLADTGVALHTFKDQVLLGPAEVLWKTGTPYTVFTPYFKAWLAKLDEEDIRSKPVGRVARAAAPRLPTLQQLGFEPTDLATLPIQPGEEGAAAALADFATRIARYDRTRDFPAVTLPAILAILLTVWAMRDSRQEQRLAIA